MPLIEAMLESGRKVVVPWCEPEDLLLFELRGLNELVPARFGLLEPPASLREDGERMPDLAEVDLIVVPGVAFDRSGGRLGHGKGYYDRLLSRRAPGTPAIALAFQCQMIDAVPMIGGDIAVDLVLTESAAYPVADQQ
jgi:5-formyltetrahydrofolate cyclo-ligase